MMMVQTEASAKARKHAADDDVVTVGGEGPVGAVVAAAPRAETYPKQQEQQQPADARKKKVKITYRTEYECTLA